MLPSELLRARVARGRIRPVFCTAAGEGGEHGLAAAIIGRFAEAAGSRMPKRLLAERIARLESGHDYKLVRGMAALLERRSVFEAATGSLPGAASPHRIRQRLFEESAARGLSLSGAQREAVIESVAGRMHIRPDQIRAHMWGDRDDNLELARFDPVPPGNLIAWYNQSLAQTLLFRCTALRFRLRGGGRYWRRVLRDVKRYGLMYALEHSGGGAPDDVTCTLEGPLSLFRMTDRYGTALAKLLPSIIGAPAWNLDGSISRRTEGGQKTYRFELSSKDAAGLFLPAGAGGGAAGAGPGGRDSYDSGLEYRFAGRFRRHFGGGGPGGWSISREPDPLAAGGKAMIPDFLFERFGRRVYLEIVGFWTKEYLDRKAAKLEALLGGKGGARADLLVAVNSELACSKIESIDSDRIFTFRGEVPIKPVLEHLRRIDAEIVEEGIRKGGGISADELEGPDVVRVTEVAARHGIPEEAALRRLAEILPEHVVSGSYMISRDRADALRGALEGVSRFVDACSALADHGIPEACHADLLPKLGYDVVWGDLDPGNGELVRRPG